jgi:hypothetical protein
MLCLLKACGPPDSKFEGVPQPLTLYSMIILRYVNSADCLESFLLILGSFQ